MSEPSALDRPIPLAELLDAAALVELLKSFAELHEVGIAVVDTDGRVLAHAAGGDRIPKEVRGVLPPPDSEPIQVDFEGSLRCDVAPLVHQGVLLGALLCGPYPPDAPSGDGIRRLAGHAAHVLAVLIDSQMARHVTARMHLATMADTYEQLADRNQRLAAAVERMQEVDRLKSNFLATVSHELRTPLTSVIGYSEMLLEGLAGALNDEQRDYVQTIMEKGDQLLQLITGILDVSRIEAGTLKIARDPVDLHDLVDGAIAAMSPLARRKRLDIHVGNKDQPRALGDRDKIRQIVLNLVGNAIKFTPDGGRVEIQVAVGALSREEDVAPFVPEPAAPLPVMGAGAAQGSSVPLSSRMGLRVRVVDSGIGIAPEKQGRIFEPFFQVDSSSTREYGGTGLGLTLVKSYVEAHGGHVWVDSDLGRGSVFTVTLPAVEEDLCDYLRATPEPPRTEESSSSPVDRTSP